MPHQAVISRLERIRSKQPWLVLSAAEKFYIAGSNNPAISHFYSFKAGDNVEESFAIPDGCVDMLFDCDATCPTAGVFGTPMSAIDIELKRQHQYFGVRFASGVIPDCLKVSAEELIEHHFDFVDVVPHANQLFEAIISEKSFASQVASFQQFFEGKANRVMSPLTRYVVANIFEQQGNVRIDAMAQETGYTTRTIQRQFRADMGMSPKAFGRIIRCQSAVYHINHHDQVVFSDMAFDLGFSDQSHFLREFKKLVKATPMAYQNRVKQQTYYDRIQHF
ncbi:helix-turn-helix domain-containing protein [Rhodanobacter aciditrophus]|uniref:Helix-turn-helix domain-containing protein n=1 Tax=Rhodanobacter aciditrophus TaxID=1623218 RepID=A0ABW4AZB0_9GAMM